MHANYIGGAWVDGSPRRNINPSDLADLVGEYAHADAAQAGQAIAAAASMRHAWANSGIEPRARALDFVGSELLLRKRELGTLLAREQGKTLAEGIGEVARAGNIFKFFGGEALRLRGDKLASVRPQVEVEVTREPVGVVGIITPWNFPMAIPAWKIAPALAYGNTVVFKPADLVPGCAWALAEIISRSGLPAGVFNLAMGRGSVVGKALLESPQVAAISFTGSVDTGRTLMTAAARRFAKVQLEMGGKNPLVILNDADLDVAVDCAVQGAYYSTGQRCTASSRFIVEKGVYAEFVRRVGETLSALQVGHALEAQTQIGPVVDGEQLASNLDYVELGQAEGARLVCGGRRLKRDTDGYFMSPALFADADAGMRIAREEIFGPVACAIPADGYEHALELANDSPFGLSAGICTTSLKHATHFKRQAQAGMVMVNVPTAGVDYHVPFGGTKGSSYGAREQGSHAAEFYTSVKTAYTRA
ncbi:aldehyde dehydrogenase family protein [Duganella sp. BJB488]|uniref:aldehyde dehydrogenase family protein n=1 Tax=unclassified Duganella TaxID=2636909 RepID=UPI000E3545AE|nr:MULTISPECIES: aldehyde dehydrogenase family protein [unclassified Duganella]RFP09288.1 aldehyde dehydrogenase family protein [Duganella sp. BJB475]RFP13177.1 aldehyde dehydrogenase family protein [Duganella sp. BJB489]RFP17226.1 aldehyde dehydrogenase family protein [Duganella sp. BJB488]RFP25323.1 aldehyde dehydrogenase family protein [Duganella sp. BJB476]RFP31531.1 aldehyde dehydrogenase family protein [Duganella sp. BJB480]